MKINVDTLPDEQLPQVTTEQIAELTDEESDKLFKRQEALRNKPVETEEQQQARLAAEQKIKEEADFAKAADDERKRLEALSPEERQKAQEEKKTADAKKAVDDQLKVKEEEDRKAAEKDGKKYYAGKVYENDDAFFNAMKEIAKPLNYPQVVLEEIVELAKKSGSLASAEKIYRELESETGRRSETERLRKEQEAQALANQKPVIPDETPEEQKYRTDLVIKAAYQAIEGSELVAQMRKEGLEIPTTPENLRELYKKDPYFGRQFESLYQNVLERFKTESLAHRTAQYEANPHNARVAQEETKKILDLVKELKLEEQFKPDQIATYVSEAYKSPDAVEIRNGVEFRRANEFAYKKFVADNLSTIVRQTTLVSSEAGRRQMLEHIEQMRERNPQSISTARIPGEPAAPEDKKKVDLNDRDAVAGLSTEDLYKALK